MNSSRPPTLLEYLIEHHFAPVAEGTWFDHHTGDQIIRVVYQPGEETQLIALAPHLACLYKAMFYVGVPDAVIIAAVEAALTLTQPEPSARSGPAGQPRDGQQGSRAARRRGRGQRP